MIYSEEELEKQTSEIRSKLAMVLIPIFVMCAGIMVYQNNSVSYNREQYLECKNIAFHGTIIKKHEDGNYPLANRYVILKSGTKIGVNNEIYDKVKFGDSVIKAKGKDTTYFYLNNGVILTNDYCKYAREEYLKLLTKE